MIGTRAKFAFVRNFAGATIQIFLYFVSRTYDFQTTNKK